MTLTLLEASVICCVTSNFSCTSLILYDSYESFCYFNIFLSTMGGYQQFVKFVATWLWGLLMVFMFVQATIEKRNLYLVLMEENSVAFPSSCASNCNYSLDIAISRKRHAEMIAYFHDNFLESKLEAGTFKKLYSFHYIVNGFAVHTADSQALKLKAANGVKLLEKDRGAKMMTTYTPEFLGLPKGVWTQGAGGEGVSGENIIVGVIDTGIDPNHPSFAYDPSSLFHHQGNPQFSGACETGPLFPSSSCNGKIVSARYFAAGASTSFALNSTIDILSPFDAVGHGSHVASIAAGNSGVPVVVNGFNYGYASGMAPRARIAVYKAIYPSGGTLADVVSAIDKAAEDGVDVIVLSIGPDEPPENSLTFLNVFDIFLLFARKAGIVVVQAAGNKGPAVASVVSFSPWAMGAGSSTTDRRYSGALILGNGQKIPAAGLSGPAFGEELFQYRLVLAKDAILRINGSSPWNDSYAEDCLFPNVLDPNLVRDSIVICNFSASFLYKPSSVASLASTAKVLGFEGFVLAANPAFGDYVAPSIPFSIPGLMISRVSDVLVLLEYYEGKTERNSDGVVINFGASASIGEGRIAFYGEEAPVVSRFSSRGPDVIDNNLTLADVLKPDVIAPGDLIWGAWSPFSVTEPLLAGYQFAPISGTSMAAPHVAGISAMVKQAHPSWSPSMIASAISTTSSPYDNNGVHIMSQGSDINCLYVSGHFDLGAGHVNPAQALDPGLVFDSGFMDYINFLCSLPNVNSTSIQLATGQACQQPLHSCFPADLNLPSITISSLNGSQTTHRSVLNVAAKPETYLSSLQPPLGVEVRVCPQWFAISPHQTVTVKIQLNATQVLQEFSFGELVFVGSLGHIVRVPISVWPVSLN